MGQRVVINRQLDLRRGGERGSKALPVILIEVQNKSGGALARGDVVIHDTANTTKDKICVTTTTGANSRLVAGMVFDAAIAADAFGRIQIYGPTDALKVDGTTDVTVGGLVGTFTAAKIGALTTGAGAFARAMEAYVANDSLGVIDAFIHVGFGIAPAA